MSVILFEPDSQTMLAMMFDSPTRRISAGTWLEACIVVNQKRSPIASARFETLLERLRLEIVAVTVEHAVIARRAYERFGKGNHAASLNYGDCFAYALAKVTDEPLLFKGKDFIQTDIEPALKA